MISNVGHSVTLPHPPEGWFECAYTVLADGRLGLIRASVNFAEDFRIWRTAYLAGETWRPRPFMPAAALGRFSVFEGSQESEAFVAPLSGRDNFSCGPDGRWLIVHARANPGDLNGRIVDAGGNLLAELPLGDGIEHVQCAPDGTIWMGYFDEGVFGGLEPDGSWSLGTAGIANLSSAGDRLFAANTAETSMVDDCYALSLAGDVAWACVYAGFPIIRMDRDATTVWRNDFTGVKALAVDGAHVALFGGYEQDTDRLALVRLRDDVAEIVGECRLAGLDADTLAHVQGCGDTLHFISTHHWRRVRVCDLVQEFQGNAR